MNVTFKPSIHIKFMVSKYYYFLAEFVNTLKLKVISFKTRRLQIINSYESYGMQTERMTVLLKSFSLNTCRPYSELEYRKSGNTFTPGSGYIGNIYCQRANIYSKNSFNIFLLLKCQVYLSQIIYKMDGVGDDTIRSPSP